MGDYNQDIFSYEIFKKYAENFEVAEVANTLRKKYGDLLEKTFKQKSAAEKFLIPNSNGHRFYRLDLSIEENIIDVFQHLAHMVLRPIVRDCAELEKNSPEKDSEEILRLAYSELIQFGMTLDPTNLTLKSWGWIACHSTSDTCAYCGQHVSMYLYASKAPHAFKPHFKTYKDSEGFVPIRTCEYNNNKVFAAEVDFPSGNILAADWFRVDGFTQIVDADEDHKISLNNAWGRVQITENYAKNHNFAKFQVGNSSPTVFASKNQIAFGYELDPKEYDRPYKETGTLLKNLGFKEKGYICTDLWAACFIDEEVLLSKIESLHGTEKAKSLIAAWKKEYSVVAFKVTPGRYKMWHDGYHHLLDGKLEVAKNFKNLKVYGYLEKCE